MASSSSPGASTLDREEVLAHFLFLQDAFVGAANCSFRGERREYLFEVADTGTYIVTIDAVDDAGQGCTVTPVLDAVDEVDEHGNPIFTCAVMCPVAELLTMLAGGAAELTTSDLREVQIFLSCFHLEGYAAFCEHHHLGAHASPSGKKVGGFLGSRVARSQQAARGAAANGERTRRRSRSPSRRSGGGETRCRESCSS